MKSPRICILLFSFLFSSVSFLEGQINTHYWNRTSGLPSWHGHSGGNWTGGLPSAGDFAYFRNATNGTVSIHNTPNLLTTLGFNYSSNNVSHVYVKFRGAPGQGFQAQNVLVGANSSRTAFVDLDGGTHRATSVWAVYDGSRLDIRSNSSAVTPEFHSGGLVNVWGGLNANLTRIAGTNADFYHHSGTTTASDFEVESGAATFWNGGTLNSNSISLDNGAFSQQGGTVHSNSVFIGSGSYTQNGGTFSPGGIVLSNGTFNYNSGNLNVSNLSFYRNSTINVASGRTIATSSMSLGSPSSLSPFTDSTVSGPGVIDVQGGITLYQSSRLTLANGIRLETDSFSESSNNGSYRRVTIDGTSTFDCGQYWAGNYGGCDMIVDGGTFNTDSAVLRSGLSGSIGGRVFLIDGGQWNNATSIQVGYGSGNSEYGYVSVGSSFGGTVNTNSMTIGNGTTADGLVRLFGNGDLNIAQALSIQSNGDLEIVGGNANVGSLELGGLIDLNSGTLNVAGVVNVNSGGTLHMNGGHSTVGSMYFNGGFIVQQNGSLTIDGGIYDIGAFSAAHFGSAAGNVFTQRFRNNATMDIGTRHLSVGHSGAGSLLVESGSVVKNGWAFLGRNSGSNGFARVQDSGSRWENAGVLAVGHGDQGRLDIVDGGVVTANRVRVGAGGGVSGIVNISNTGSRFEVSQIGSDPNTNGNILIGEFGTADLNISQGGYLSNVTGSIATQVGSTGDVSVDGIGSVWMNSENLWVGGGPTASGGTATLAITNGGTVFANDVMKIWDDGMVTLDGGILDVGTLDLSVATAEFDFLNGTLSAESIVGDLIQEGGTLAPGNSSGLTTIDGDYDFLAGAIEIEIGGLVRGTEYDGINVNGHANLNGVFDIHFVDGFVPTAGHSFLLVDASSFSGTPAFDFDDAALGSEWVWDTSQFSTNGTIMIVNAVPEPNAMIAVTLLFGAAALRRRRRR